MPTTHPGLLVRGVRLVPVTAPAPDRPIDVRVRDGAVTAVAPSLHTEAGERVVDGGGRWLIPGLWDAHVHMTLWARSLQQLALGIADSPDRVL